MDLGTKKLITKASTVFPFNDRNLYLPSVKAVPFAKSMLILQFRSQL